LPASGQGLQDLVFTYTLQHQFGGLWWLVGNDLGLPNPLK